MKRKTDKDADGKKLLKRFHDSTNFLVDVGIALVKEDRSKELNQVAENVWSVMIDAGLNRIEVFHVLSVLIGILKDKYDLMGDEGMKVN